MGGFEPATSTSEGPQTHALDRAATGTSQENLNIAIISRTLSFVQS